MTNPDHLGHRKRAKTKFLASMGEELHDYELLEILLFSALPRGDTKWLAKKLLSKFDDLSGVINADPNHLKQIEGVGDSVITCLKINAQIINRILKNKAKDKTALNNWPAILNYAKNAFGDLKYEVFRVIFLDKKHQIIEDQTLASGENDFVNIEIKNIVRQSLLLHASSLILMHNHPTRDVKASQSDIKTTSAIEKALKPVNISILDHIIIGKNQYFSFKEEGIL